MVEISLSGSGEGPGKETTRAYSTKKLDHFDRLRESCTFAGLR